MFKSKSFFALLVVGLFASGASSFADCSTLQQSANSVSGDQGVAFDADLKSCEANLVSLTAPLENGHYPTDFNSTIQNCRNDQSSSECNLVVRASNAARSALGVSAQNGTFQSAHDLIQGVFNVSVQDAGAQSKLTIVQNHMKGYFVQLVDSIKSAAALEDQLTSLQNSMVNNGRSNANNLEPYLRAELQMAVILNSIVRYQSIL